MRTFCLYCPEVPERFERAKKHFAARNLRVTFLRGIHGETSGLETVFSGDGEKTDGVWKMPPRSVGLWVAHYMRWVALSLLPDDHFLLLEDDAELPENWEERLCSALRDVPQDFDILYVGNCCCAGKPTQLIAGEVYRVEYPLCQHAHIIARKALSTLIATQRKVYTNSDISLGIHTLPKLAVYTVLPSIFYQEGTPLPL